MLDITKDNLTERLLLLKQSINIPEIENKISELNRALSDPNIWDDTQKAAALAKELKLNQEKKQRFLEIQELLDIAETEDLTEISKKIDSLETETFLSGPKDSQNAVLTVHSGLGGVDAMDFAEMIFRMYVRLAESKGWRTKITEETHGEEAGIKKSSMIIEGENVYGWLKGEAGVHRLIRLSPFNAKNLRQTSFCLVDIIPEVTESEVVIKPEDIKIDTFRSSGHGGQSVNTTDSAVRLTHVPTGIAVSVQNERSQSQNREIAMRILVSKLNRLNELKFEEEKAILRGEVPENSFGSQIRTYTLHPYNLVKDHRTGYESANTQAILNGELDNFLEANLRSL